MNTLHLTSDIVRALGWSILHSLWQAFLVFACLKIVLRALPQAGARIKHNLSLISLTGIFLWFLATFYIHFDRLQEARSALITIRISDLPAGQVPTPVVYDSQYFWLYLIPRLENFFPYLVTVYALGMLLMCIKLGSDLFQLQKIRTVNTEPIGEAWQKYVQKLAAQLQIPRNVQLLISHQLSVPVMLGFFKPIILVPIAMVNNLSESQLEAVLLHELAHIKRNDYLLNIFQSVVETILFFNPFIWLISKIIRIEREHCCDDLVIANTAQPIQYAHALVALAEYKLNVNRLTMAAADNKQHLFHRIKRIMEMKTRHLNYTQKFLAVLVIATGLVSIAWLNPAKGKSNEAKQDNKKQSATFSAHSVSIVPDGTKDSSMTRTKDSVKYSHTVTFTIQDSTQVPGSTHVTFDPPSPLPPPLPPNPAPAPGRGPIPTPAPAPPMPPAVITMSGNPGSGGAVITIKSTPGIMITPAVSAHRKENANYNYNYAYTIKDTLIDDVNVKHQIQVAQQSVNFAMQELKNVDMVQLQKDIQTATANINAAKLSKETKLAYEKSLAALQKINWNEVSNAQKEAAKALRSINIDSINNNIAIALKSVNFDEVGAEVNKAMADANISSAEAQKAMLAGLSGIQNGVVSINQGNSNAATINVGAARKDASVKTSKLKELVKAMENDKLLDSNKGYKIDRKGNDLYINGTKQPNSVLDKYRSYFPGNEVSISGSPEDFNVKIQN